MVAEEQESPPGQGPAGFHPGLQRERKLNALLWALRSINKLIVVETDPEQLLQSACDLLTTSMGYENAWATRINSDGAVAQVVGSGVGTAFETLQHRLRDKTPPACMQRALADLNEVAVMHPSQDCDDCPLAASYPEHRGMARALTMAGESHGTLTVCASKENAGDAEHHSLLSEVAEDLGFALAGIQLTHQQVRQELILDAIRDEVLLIDLEGKVLHLNKAAQDRQATAQTRSFDPEVLQHARTHGSWRGVVSETDATGRRRLLDRHVWRLDDAHGDRNLVCAVSRDVTDQHRAKETAQAQVELLERLGAGVPGVLMQFASRGHEPIEVLYASGGVQDVLELSVHEVRADAMSILERVVAEDRTRVQRAFRKGVRSRRPVVEEFRVDLPNAGQRWLRGSASPQKQPDGGVLWHGYLEDITDRVQLELRLRQSEKMEAIGQLAGGVAHDFNNLLMSIMGNAELAQLTLQDPSPDSQEELLEHLSEIDGAAARAAAVTRQLLSFSRRDEVELRAVDLNEVISNLFKLIQRSIGETVQLSFHRNPSISMVLADAGQIEQIVLNLCVNARDAMPEGGPVRISLREVRLTSAELSSTPWAKPGRFVEISVEDCGTGIPDRVGAQIFEPFFTTKATGRGTGLGLATAYGIAQRHEGRIDFESTPGKGTIFRVALPVAAPETVSVDLPSAEYPKGNGQLILVAEDQAPLRRLAERTLRGAGYRTVLAADGEEAIKIIDIHKQEIDLALLDVVMPNKNGVHVAEHLRGISPGTPIVFMTGHTHSALPPGQTLPANSGVIRKPYARLDLLRHLAQCLPGHDHD